MTPAFANAPNNAQTKNTFDGENRSTMVRIAKSNVPVINPNCTAEVKCPSALLAKPK